MLSKIAILDQTFRIDKQCRNLLKEQLDLIITMAILLGYKIEDNKIEVSSVTNRRDIIFSPENNVDPTIRIIFVVDNPVHNRIVSIHSTLISTKIFSNTMDLYNADDRLKVTQGLYSFLYELDLDIPEIANYGRMYDNMRIHGSHKDRIWEGDIHRLIHAFEDDPSGIGGLEKLFEFLEIEKKFGHGQTVQKGAYDEKREYRTEYHPGIGYRREGD